ncbi:chemotaxis protein CheB [Rhodobacteraceae bacterium 2376]|uniref:protein-glutamate methylesterase n=1 Tax=Rhabdonatronobacter sediminivivens TaxID=2743469 RepID=A0A7Z0I0P9_9RHOB|nr:CheB methylesterase domain-containing protein [Rhabdonatronobacter sediminivivens]NYS25720.1 chemotaxis protein CheB [Rhabdonatronobacter sediminivivens]
MRNSGPWTLLVADPNSLRREKILQAYADRPDIRAVGAASIGEAYRQTEALLPKRVSLASEFAQMREFPGLDSLFKMIGAEVVIHGNALSGVMPMAVPPARARANARRTALHHAGAANPEHAPGPAPAGPAIGLQGDPGHGPDIIGIGASTGGIVAIEHVLAGFPADCPPTLIVQHIRPGFAEGVVRRLDRMVAPRVVAATDGADLRRGYVYFATEPGRHLSVIQRAGLRARLSDEPEVCGHRPAVDVLFTSLAKVTGRFRIAAALLTGMGTDGADGMALLRQGDAFTIAQDKATSIIWGMPQAAIQAGGAAAVLPLDRIAAALLRCKAPAARTESGQ